MSTTDPRCGKTYSGLRSEHCTICHETFTGTTAGDRHRVQTLKGSGRWRCLTPDEMTAKGMELKKSGRWGLVGTWEGPDAEVDA